VDGTGDDHLVEFTGPDAGQRALHALDVGVRPAVADLGRAAHRLPKRQRPRLQVGPAAADARVANVAITLAPVHEFGEAQLAVRETLPDATCSGTGRESEASDEVAEARLPSAMFCRPLRAACTIWSLIRVRGGRKRSQNQ
jgi:hypothetical protein